MSITHRSPLDDAISAIVMVALFAITGTIWRLLTRRKKKSEQTVGDKDREPVIVQENQRAQEIKKKKNDDLIDLTKETLNCPKCHFTGHMKEEYPYLESFVLVLLLVLFVAGYTLYLHIYPYYQGINSNDGWTPFAKIAAIIVSSAAMIFPGFVIFFIAVNKLWDHARIVCPHCHTLVKTHPSVKSTRHKYLKKGRVRGK